MILIKFTCIMLRTHFAEKEEYLPVKQKPKVREKMLASVANQRIITKATSSCSDICVLNRPKAQTQINNVSKRLTFGVIKTIMPCVEGDRSDFQPSTTTAVLSFRLREIGLASG